MAGGTGRHDLIEPARRRHRRRRRRVPGSRVRIVIALQFEERRGGTAMIPEAIDRSTPEVHRLGERPANDRSPTTVRRDHQRLRDSASAYQNTANRRAVGQESFR